MSQHTQGKLKVADDGSLGTIIAENGDGIGHTFQVSADDQLAGSPIRKANARRIVAAWNACDGLTTEQLENVNMLGDTLADRFKALRESESELMVTVDELFQALKLISESEATECSHEYCKGIARAAIKKAEGV